MWKIPPVNITQIDPFHPLGFLFLPPPPTYKEGVDIFWNHKLGENISLVLKLMVTTNACCMQYLKKEMSKFDYILKQALCFGYLEPPRIGSTLLKCIK